MEVREEKVKEIYISSNERKCIKSIEEYGLTYSNIETKTKASGGIVCSICYGKVEGKMISVFRARVYNYNTLTEVYFDGNVYDTTYCEKVSFEEIIEKTKVSLKYQLKKLEEL